MYYGWELGLNITEYRETPRNYRFVKTLFPRYCVHKRYAMAGKGFMLYTNEEPLVQKHVLKLQTYNMTTISQKR